LVIPKNMTNVRRGPALGDNGCVPLVSSSKYELFVSPAYVELMQSAAALLGLRSYGSGYVFSKPCLVQAR